MNRKRYSAVALTVAAVLLGGGIAAAFWSTSGSGGGSADVGSDAGVTVAQANTVAGLVPGGTAQPIDFTVTNSSATAPVQIRTVVIGFGSTFTPGCSAADFVLTQPAKPSVGTPLSIAASGSLAFTSGGAGALGGTGAAIAMLNTSLNQDACKLATVPLTFTVT
ncbi:MAG: hypothetical protein ABI807_00700 [Sporichthyaceae bacterium]